VSRILITGSRSWTNITAVRDALKRHWHKDAVLISGACPRGADAIAEHIWSRWGGRIERHPAQWSSQGKAAGFIRNAEMVDSGATVCLAFIRSGSHGATHCAALAEAAGIPTERHTAD
jgi:YspA, cpYpsA-related SLOG family